MALMPICFICESRRCQARIGTAAPSPLMSWCMPAPLNFRLVPLRLKPASASYLIVRMPNGTTSSSTVVLPTRTLAVSV